MVCTPRNEYFNVSDLKAQNMNEIADRDKTMQQHDRLKSTMAEFGCEVIDVPELGGHPNSVFTRDVALCTPNGYIKLRMGLEARRGEEQWMAQILEANGVIVHGLDLSEFRKGAGGPTCLILPVERGGNQK